MRAQTLYFLLNVDTSWKESWCPDPKWNQQTEGGKPAETLDEFEKVIMRDNHWICIYGLQAVCCLKKVCITVWQLTEDGWGKIALLQPKERGAKTPVLGLVLFGGHW